MASGVQQRPKSNSWVRTEGFSSEQGTGSRRSKVWTRLEALGGVSASQRGQPAATPPLFAEAPVQQQQLSTRSVEQSQAQRPLPHAANGAVANSQLRHAASGAGCSARDGAVRPPAVASQQYVRKRPNQLTLSVSQQRPNPVPAAPAPVQLRHAPVGPARRSGGPAPGGFPPARPQPAALQAAGSSGRHPRDALQQQMAERAAALAGRPHKPLHRPASAPPATATGPQQQAALARKVCQKVASKRWVRPETAAASGNTVRAADAAAHTPVPASAERRQGGLVAGSPAASRTPRRAYRPLLPAWAVVSSRAKGSSAFSSTPSSQRRQNTSLQAKRKARSWVRQDSQAKPEHDVLALTPKALRKAAHVWQRDRTSTAGATSAVAALQRRQAAPRLPARQPSAPSKQKKEQPATRRQPAKLQRIGEHMYRVGGGEGRSRTLQRQMHMPAPAVSTPAQVAEQVPCRV